MGRRKTDWMPQEVRAAVLIEAARYGISRQLADFVLYQETLKLGRASIPWINGRRSSKVRRGPGAVGPMQVRPGTARYISKRHGKAHPEIKNFGKNPRNVVANIRGGLLYLREQLRENNGNITKTLAAYNWGPGASRKYREGKSKWLPPQTRKYLGFYQQFIKKEHALPDAKDYLTAARRLGYADPDAVVTAQLAGTRQVAGLIGEGARHMIGAAVAGIKSLTPVPATPIIATTKIDASSREQTPAEGRRGIEIAAAKPIRSSYAGIRRDTASAGAPTRGIGSAALPPPRPAKTASADPARTGLGAPGMLQKFMENPQLVKMAENMKLARFLKAVSEERRSSRLRRRLRKYYRISKSDIRSFQKGLKEAGITAKGRRDSEPTAIKVDGIVGPQMRNVAAAIMEKTRDVQARHNEGKPKNRHVKVDGLLGPQTASILKDDLKNPQVAARPAPSSSRQQPVPAQPL